MCEALRRPLCTLAGTTGFRELLKRALAVARVQVPALSSVRVDPDGSFQGLTKLVVDQDSEAEIMLISELLALLVAVGTTLASGPPHGSAQAGLRHAALTLDHGGQPLFRPGMVNASRG